MKRFVGPPKERFWNFVLKHKGDDACWEWTGAKCNPGRIGVLMARQNGRRKKLSASRLSYEMHVGPIPETSYVWQTCKNSSCVNPSHLALRSGRIAEPIEERFRRFVAKSDGCWEWIGGRNQQGYGQIKVANGGQGRTGRVHRLSYEWHVGPIPDGMEVCHKCDNPPCVRPDHLFLGTARDNARDKVAKGRQTRGEMMPHAKLTMTSAEEARELYAIGRHTQQQIAARLGVSQTLIGKVVRYEIWKPDKVLQE